MGYTAITADRIWEMTQANSCTVGYPVSKRHEIHLDPIVIGPQELASIKLAALRVFHETHVLPEDGKEAQIYMILEGFHSFLAS